MKKKRICIGLIMMMILLFAAGISAGAASISKTSLDMYVGQKTKLTVKGLTNVKWSSSRKSVAAVTSKGQVTAKKAGSATITAKSGKKKLTCKIKVRNPYLNAKTVRLGVGDTFQLSLTGAAAKTWKSSNTKVASMSSRTITANKAGSATVTCLAKNGRSYKCKVVVTAASPKLSKVSGSWYTVDSDYNLTKTVIKKDGTCTVNGKAYTINKGTFSGEEDVFLYNLYDGKKRVGTIEHYPYSADSKQSLLVIKFTGKDELCALKESEFSKVTLSASNWDQYFEWAGSEEEWIKEDNYYVKWICLAPKELYRGRIDTHTSLSGELTVTYSEDTVYYTDTKISVADKKIEDKGIPYDTSYEAEGTTVMNQNSDQYECWFHKLILWPAPGTSCEYSYKIRSIEGTIFVRK